MVSSDTLVHTWDLSRATGRDEQLDPADVQTTLDWISPMADQIRFPGRVRPGLDPPPGGTARLACSASWAAECEASDFAPGSTMATERRLRAGSHRPVASSSELP